MVAPMRLFGSLSFLTLTLVLSVSLAASAQPQPHTPAAPTATGEVTSTNRTVIHVGHELLWGPTPADAARGLYRLALPAGIEAVSRQERTLAPGVHVTEVRAMLGTRVWTALISDSKSDPLFADFLGMTSDTDDRIFGRSLHVDPIGSSVAPMVRITRGVLDPARALCGQPETPLAPELLEPTSLTWVPVALQRLTPERRAIATELKAEPEAHAVSFIDLLINPMSSDGQDAHTLIDGHSQTGWHEQRTGVGPGEFVTFQVPHHAPLTQLVLTLAQAPEFNAQPRTVYIATDLHLYHVDLGADFANRGQALTFDLPTPETTSCLSVILDSAFDRKQKAPVVGLAEVSASSTYPNVEALLATLNVANAPEAGLALQLRAGPKMTLARSLAQQSEALRTNVADAVFASAGCEDAGVLLGALLGANDAAIATRAKSKVEHCGHGAETALRFALGGQASAYAASQLAIANPQAAFAALPDQLGKGDAAARQATRVAFARAASKQPPAQFIQVLNGAETRSRTARIEMLRALASIARESHPELTAELTALLQNANFDERYVLLEPLVELANHTSEAAKLLRENLIQGQAPVKAKLLELLDGNSAYYTLFTRALRDENPRVRAGAALDLQKATAARSATQNAPPNSSATTEAEGRALETTARHELEARLTGDPFSFVQTNAAAALGEFPANPSTTTAFVAALRDPSAPVRAAALLGLGKVGALSAHEAVLQRMQDTQELSDVRASAALTLGRLCAKDDTDDLLDAALLLRDAYASESQVRVGLAALEALGDLGSEHLRDKLHALLENGSKKPVRDAATRAINGPHRCLTLHR